MGLLTLCTPSSHSKEAETIDLSIVPSMVSENDSFCPRDLNDRTLGLTWILSAPAGAVTFALYIDIGDPTFVTVLLKTRLTVVEAESSSSESYTRPGSTALIGFRWPDPYANSASKLMPELIGKAARNIPTGKINYSQRDLVVQGDSSRLGGTLQPHKAPQPDPRQGSNFTPQLFQRTLEETLDSFQKSIHGDMRNLRIEILRQFHMQEMEMSRVMSSILENQAELMKEVQSLRKENQQIRQLL
ncbi:hypothetical protein QQP08_004144 [Theobroma cacao]|nr:hypothetical protein QQP08_004144 [Theobroma cacao]